jgi:hypothetical protein
LPNQGIIFAPSLSDYMRRRALGDDDLLAELLSALQASTASARHALDDVIAKLELAEASRAERDASVYEQAVAEFADVDPAAFAELARPQTAADTPEERRRRLA